MATVMRKTLNAIFLIAITMGVAIALSTLLSASYEKHKQDDNQVKVIISDKNDLKENEKPILFPSKRVSRFLHAEETSNHHHSRRSLKPADHCHKDYDVCLLEYGVNSTCCGNKCFDLANDKAHCGACHKKCKFTYNCCGGKCVDLDYDKRHCGSCNNKCLLGQYCIYGMCDYA